jgi:hypothetical protein
MLKTGTTEQVGNQSGNPRLHLRPKLKDPESQGICTGEGWGSEAGPGPSGSGGFHTGSSHPDPDHPLVTRPQ